MTAAGDALKAFSSPRWAILLPLLVGSGALAVTALAWSSVRDQEQDLVKATFAYCVRDAERRIAARGEDYQMILRAAQGAFLANDVSRDEFQTFVEGLRLREALPGIQGVGFARVIPRGELEVHQASVRAEGFPNYTVHPPSSQDPITSIVLLEPHSGRNLRAFGYDMYTEPVRRAAMDEARRVDDVIASGKVKLVQESDQDVQFGFLMYLPVFAPLEEGTPDTDAPKRRLRGWMYAPFRMNDFMDGLLGERADDLDVELYDGDTTSAEAKLYDRNGDAGTVTDSSQLRDTRTIQIAHHTWTMTTRSQPGMAARLGPDRSWNIAWSGGLASLLLAALTGVLVSGRSGALAIADERQRRYDVVADSAPVLIWTSGTDTLYDSFNAPWLAFTGRTLAQELGNGWKEGVHPDDLKRCVDSYLAAFHARKPFSMEYRLRHADGAWRWIVDNGVARYLPNGTFVGYIGSCFDITERKHLRDELQRAVRQQEILLDTANVGIVMIVERRQLAVNRGMEELFGYTRAEMLGQTTRMYYPTQEAFDAFGRAAYPEVAKGLTFETEVELRRKDGSTLWVLYNGRAVDPHDPSKGSMWVLTDCTAERQAEEMLRESEARFRDLFESNSAVMLLVDPIDRAIVDANPAAATFYRYERAALQAMSIGQLNALPDEQLTDLLAHASAAHTTRFVVPHRLADGQLRTVEVNSSPTDFGGRRLLFSIIQDVTAREESHAALVRERERYRSLMDISQDGIHVLDLHGTLIDANPAFLRMLARKPDAIESLNVRDWDAAIPEADIEARVRALIERPDLFETRHRRADGTVFDVEVHAGGVELDGRSYLLAASRDITSRIELEHQLASNQVHLKELNSSLAERVEQTVAELRAKDQLLITQSRQAAMGEMVGNIAHQWRQPLNALALVLADLRDTSRLGELDGPTLDKAVADGNRLIQKMSSTINDFRDFLQPEKEKHFFSAVAQIRETMELLAPSFDHAGVVLTIDAPVDFRLFGFTNEYAQVLMNLLANAKEAIVGSGVAHGRVTVSLVEQDGHGYLTVLDNGGGIPVANLDRIFEPYFSTKDGGTGIGLYMSRQIVERSLGGRLEVRNVEGGAEFVVITPIADTTH